MPQLAGKEVGQIGFGLMGKCHLQIKKTSTPIFYFQKY